jgi:hypothetical protein
MHFRCLGALGWDGIGVVGICDDRFIPMCEMFRGWRI